MNRVFGEVLAGALMSVLILVIGGSVIAAGIANPEMLRVPPVVWALGFVVLAGAQLTAMWGMDELPSRTQHGLLLIVGILGPVLLLLAPNAGWLTILAVLSVAIAAYALTPLWILAMIVVNSMAIAVMVIEQGTSGSAVALIVAIHVILQIAMASSVRSLRSSEALSRRLAAAHAELAARNAELQAAAALLADSERADERLRISRELHDVSGHQLTALALELELAVQGPREQVDDRVRRARTLASELLGDIRATVGELRRDDLDVAAALKQMTSDLPTLEVHLAIDPELRLDPELGRTLVRCAQEAITNTIRHAGAKNFWLRLCRDDAGFIELEAQDDGAGTAVVAMGNGLTGMAERLRVHDGELSLSGDAGFRVLARVPG